jgi:hypothetical protein
LALSTIDIRPAFTVHGRKQISTIHWSESRNKGRITLFREGAARRRSLSELHMQRVRFTVPIRAAHGAACDIFSRKRARDLSIPTPIEAYRRGLFTFAHFVPISAAPRGCRPANDRHWSLMKFTLQAAAPPDAARQVDRDGTEDRRQLAPRTDVLATE